MAAASQGTLSVRLDGKARLRLEKAAALMHQSSDAFLGRVGDEVARRIVLDWTVEEYRRGERTFGELAEDTGLWIEEIMTAMAPGGAEQILATPFDETEAQTDPVLRRAIERTIDELLRRTE